MHQIIFQEFQKSFLFYHFFNVGISLVRFRLVLKNVKFYPSAYFPLPAFILISCLGSNSYFYFTDKRVNIVHCRIYILLNCSPFMILQRLFSTWYVHAISTLLPIFFLSFYSLKAVLLLQARIYCSINPLFLRASFVISFNLPFFGGFVVVTINAPREF